MNYFRPFSIPQKAPAPKKRKSTASVSKIVIVSDSDEEVDDTPLCKMDSKEDKDYKPPTQKISTELIGRKRLKR